MTSPLHRAPDNLGEALLEQENARLRQAAEVVLHARSCVLPIEDCVTCAALIARATEGEGFLDVALADLDGALM